MTFYRYNANVVRQVNQNIENARNAKAFEQWTDNWVNFVARNVGAWMHVEHILGLYVFAACNRSGPTNMHNTAMVVNSMHKIRFAQDLALYNLTLSEEIDGFDGTAHLDAWNNDEAWQGVRKVTERLTAVDNDWGESVFATNVVFEPLIGELFRSNLVQQIAAQNGDFVTPTVIGAGEYDYSQRDLRWTQACFGPLTHRQGVRRPQQAADAGMAVGLGARVPGGGAHAAAAVEPARRQAAALRGLPRPGQEPLRRNRVRPRTPDPRGAEQVTRTFKTAESPYKADNTASGKAGVTLMNNQVGVVVAEVMDRQDNVTVTQLPSMIRVDCVGRMDFVYDDISEALGEEPGFYDASEFEENMSTHYGKMIHMDDRTVMFGNLEEAAEFIGDMLPPEVSK